jgi:hypothetical protein
VNVESLTAGILAVLVLAYLVYTLAHPERL